MKRLLAKLDFDQELRFAYPGDAGIDLQCAQSVKIEPGGFADIPTGVSVQLPDGYWAMLTGRSSTLRKRGLLVSQGIIDQGYRGPLFAGVWNLTEEPVYVDKGDRIAQLILLPLFSGEIVVVDQLDPTERGTNGFGSSGR